LVEWVKFDFFKGDNMEVGRIAEIDKSQSQHIEKIQKVQETAKSDKVDPNEQYKNQTRGEVTDANEVILDNVRFGFNKKSQDFFVKVVRGDMEYKYPSDQMMKLKAFLLESMNNNN
jgi:hypothetical protein